MLPYSPYPAQRARQIAADAADILAVVAVVIVASAVVAAIRAVAELGRQLEAAGGSISEGLSAAGERLGGIPLIGDAVSRPFDAAAGAGDSVSDAGAAVIDVVETAAVIAGWVVALSLLTLIALVWVWPRVRPPALNFSGTAPSRGAACQAIPSGRRRSTRRPSSTPAAPSRSPS